MIGAWYWDGSEQLDFRPRDYWPADTTVSFDGHLNGVEGAPGMYGVHDLTQSFSIGQSVIAVASTDTHRTQIYVGGKLAYTWPISTGRATMPTPDGTYLTVQKNNPVRMIGGGKKAPPATTTSSSTGRSGSPSAATTTTRPRGRSSTRAPPTSATAA